MWPEMAGDPQDNRHLGLTKRALGPSGENHGNRKRLQTVSHQSRFEIYGVSEGVGRSRGHRLKPTSLISAGDVFSPDSYCHWANERALGPSGEMK